MPGSVMVPVLSTQRVSTRARVSTQFMSRTRTFRRDRRMTLRTRATLVRRYSPSGIMPMRAETVETMLSETDRSALIFCEMNRAIPIGMRAMPMNLMSLSSESIISDLEASTLLFACAARRDA